MHATLTLLFASVVLLLASRTCLADPLSSYYGTYTSLASDLQACENMLNGACKTSCCPMNYTLQQTSSPSTPNLIVYYDPTTLSRCSGSTNEYLTSLALSSDGNGNTVGTGTISTQPIVLTFNSGSTFTTVIGSASPQCSIRTNVRQQSGTTATTTTTGAQPSTSAARGLVWSWVGALVVALAACAL